ELAEPLEGVGRGTRLEGAAPEHRDALVCDDTGRLEGLLPALDRAGSGDEAEIAVADPAAADLDQRRIGGEYAADELGGLQHREHLVDARVPLERQRREKLALADRSDHGRLAPRGDERSAAGLLEPRDDMVDLLLGGGGAHDDEELRCTRD